MGKIHGYIAAGIGGLCLCAAIGAFFGINAILNNEIKKARVIDSPNASGYDTFVNGFDEDATKKYQAYKFFTLNPLDFGGTAAGLAQALATGKKIGVVESPTYVYRRYDVLDDVRFTDGGNKVSYYDRVFRIFDAEATAAANVNFNTPGFTQDPKRDVIYNYNPFFFGALAAGGNYQAWALLHAYSLTVIEITQCAFAPNTCTIANPADTCLLAGVGAWAGKAGVSAGAAGTVWSPGPGGLLNATHAQSNLATLIGLAQALQTASAGGDLAATGAVAAQINSIYPYFTADKLSEFGAVATFFVNRAGTDGTARLNTILGTSASSPIEGFTVDTWLFGWTDPLLAALNPACCSTIYDGRRGSSCPAMQRGLQSNATTTVKTAANGGKTTTLRTGKDDSDRIGWYEVYEDQSCIAAYPGCGPVEGTGGTGFKIGMKEADEALVWVSQVEHPLALEFKTNIKIKGIKTLEYRLKESELNQASQGVTSDRGMFDISRLISGVPLVLSKHNFLDAGPNDGSNKYGAPYGITPEVGLHDTYIAVEPIAGVALDVHKRLQINVNTTGMRNVIPPVAPFTTMDLPLVPVLKVDEYGQISDEDADTFKSKVIVVKTVALALLIALLVIGALLVVVGFVCLFKSNNQHAHQEVTAHQS